MWRVLSISPDEEPAPPSHRGSAKTLSKRKSSLDHTFIRVGVARLTPWQLMWYALTESEAAAAAPPSPTINKQAALIIAFCESQLRPLAPLTIRTLLCACCDHACPVGKSTVQCTRVHLTSRKRGCALGNPKMRGALETIHVAPRAPTQVLLVLLLILIRDPRTPSLVCLDGWDSK